MIKYFKNDFKSVKGAIDYITNNRIPVGIIILWYMIMAPIGFILLPFEKIWSMIVLRKIDKIYREEA